MSYAVKLMIDKIIKKKIRKPTLVNKQIQEMNSICPPAQDGKWIYLLTDGVNLKIGISANPIKRAKQIKTDNCELLAICTPNTSIAKQSEKATHAALYDINVRHVYSDGIYSDEWFEFDLYKVLNMLKAHCKQVEWINNKWLSLNI